MVKVVRASKSLESEETLESVISEDDGQSNPVNYQPPDYRRIPWVSLLLNSACLIVYSYTIYYQNYDSK